MPYELIVKPSAEKELEQVPRPIRRRVLEKMEQVQGDPRGGGAIKLRGSRATFRVRVGDWRIVYELDEPGKRVHITIIAHRH
jgi:mRNA interferase RelE/StbE